MKHIITCPSCGAKLSVPDIPGIKDKTIACPKCHFKAKVSVYMGGSSAQGGHGADDDCTQLSSAVNAGMRTTAPGKIVILSSETDYHLKVGHNVIGRQASSSTAVIQIPGDPYMSRRHVDIEVVEKNGGVEHILNEIDSKNVVKLNGEDVGRGEVLLLSFGDRLTLGTTEVEFRQGEEEEATKLI